MPGFDSQSGRQPARLFKDEGQNTAGKAEGMQGADILSRFPDFAPGQIDAFRDSHSKSKVTVDDRALWIGCRSLQEAAATSQK